MTANLLKAVFLSPLLAVALQAAPAADKDNPADMAADAASWASAKDDPAAAALPARMAWQGFDLHRVTLTPVE